MYCIGICDDDSRYLDLISNATKRYFAEKEESNYEISQFSNPDDLIVSLNKSKGYDILLLDICMPGLNGTDLVKELKALGYKTEIIFLTTSKDYALDAFALQVSNYILKPFEYSVFKKALDTLFEKLERGNLKYIALKTQDGIRRVGLSDIIYTESQGNYLNIILTKGESVRIRETGKNFCKQLNDIEDSFVLCGASYVVNIEHIHKINPKEIALSNGQKLSIPRGGYTEIKDKYFAYYFGSED